MPGRWDENNFIQEKNHVSDHARKRREDYRVRATGKLTDQDYQEILIPSLEALINQHGKIRLLCYMDDEFTGLEAGAMWDDAKFYLPHKDDFEKMAIVGGPKWIKLIMKLFAPLMKGDVKIFSGEQLSKAWEWIRA